MKQELINAYYHTSYNIFEPPISIKIGQQNPQLDILLKNHHQSCWAYVTAYNPFSELLPDEENEERHCLLKDKLNEYPFLEGEGVGLDPSWNPEKSLLILGISETDAVKLGEYFQQNAIVVGRRKGQARLVLLK
ncbi:DUF3293 domain-containing protein [Christiangramia fulva]|uniref:DUF3293 domain-containing protein n=1 Tax=Christiangramia fulva TaxID=2126553 RepID=A0A2R3Z3C1_9FLAO|nr:DUF3293 domain-containing protein [Christiangramia fulva]AVR44763.1 DUF3293 domain-containing protein [Christiangramia fulva]